MEMTNSLVRLWVTPEYKFESYLKGLAYFFLKKLLKHINFFVIWLFLPNFSVGHWVWGVKNQNFWKKKRLTNSRFAAKPIHPHIVKSHDSLVLVGTWKNWIFIKKIRNSFSFSKNLMSTLFFWKCSIKSQFGS